MKLKRNMWVWHRLYHTRCFIVQVLKKGKKAIAIIPGSEGETILEKKNAQKLPCTK